MSKSGFRLRYNEDRISYWADRYEISEAETQLVEVIGPEARKQGYFSRDQFLAACHWKTPRTAPRCAENSPRWIQEVTGAALATSSEGLRIEVFTLLRGVSWPTASVLLHIAHADPYPIVDFRALWSLQQSVPKQYGFTFWWAYTESCRSLAERAAVDMRTLDRALWQYSKERQRT